MSDVLISTMIEHCCTSPEWQDWAGDDYFDRIHKNVNMRGFEDSQMFFNRDLEMPFIVIWMADQQSRKLGSTSCFLWSGDIVMVVQDNPQIDGKEDSLMYFEGRMHQLIQEIGEYSTREPTKDSLHLTTVRQVSPAKPVPLWEETPEHKAITTTWLFTNG